MSTLRLNTLTWVRWIQNKHNCRQDSVSLTGSNLIEGFLGNRQYADMALIILTKKSCSDLCLECSTCAMFFSSSLTLSIMARLRISRLSPADKIEPFMLVFKRVSKWIPSTNNVLNKDLDMYPPSSTSLPYISLMNCLSSKGLRSSILPFVNAKLSSSPRSLQIRCSLNP